MNQNKTSISIDDAMPFGQYKGQPICQVAEKRDYVRFVCSQAHLRQRHPEVIRLLEFGQKNESSLTPAHNRVQLRFLDSDYCYQLFFFITPDVTQATLESVEFESGGIDVRLKFSFLHTEKDKSGKEYQSREEARLYIEVKPSISDDFPQVLRQALFNTSGIGSRSRNAWGSRVVVFTDEFYAESATEEQAKKFFKSSGVDLVLAKDIANVKTKKVQP